jgi:hypothetical protein
MSITLAEALPLKRQLERRRVELITERKRISTSTIEKGENVETPARTMDVVSMEIAHVEKGIRISRANLEGAF